MTIRLFTMGLKCFGRFDFIVLTFLRKLRHTEYAYYFILSHLIEIV